mmetsp:Transcript_10443/g.30667  ORF Transcript_10443/g.30667 Transcript_10443/m.30667 type:complete len:190 (+) Transcript_10443:107-676(+)|eukprot:CAMPEP_0168422894 /NCGR_PEP_ID=MMETSP0228-20121227/34028_1 /TAXON_ID=133427 /ORGANISM="Protoceratium reticulatum, Strain CCCM 535 (=CCMP 1889)" /LENGTH=189 /DNA_ID=CAMNT_0008436839 /DNA_START=101 /DNA_END=670 /DNA_ORIENTATION=+
MGHAGHFLQLLVLLAAWAGGHAIPLELANASCADPPIGLPRYCCNGIIPNADFIDTCECNPGWTQKECICKEYLTSMPCHQCMVHLPGTNRWMKSFTMTELYDNCATCVARCKAELANGECSSFMGDVWGRVFPEKQPEQVLCTNDYLKSQLMKSDYPVAMKRALYKAPRLHADDDYHQPADWQVEGVR